MALLVTVALTVAWALVAELTGWRFAYLMVIVHAGVAYMGAESMI